MSFNRLAPETDPTAEDRGRRNTPSNMTGRLCPRPLGRREGPTGGRGGPPTLPPPTTGTPSPGRNDTPGGRRDDWGEGWVGGQTDKTEETKETRDNGSDRGRGTRRRQETVGAEGR